MTPLAIDVKHLNKSFEGKHVVKDLSLQIQTGDIFGFLGPNGSGKTTSIRLMCGLLTPDSGEGTCLGMDIFRQRKEIKQNIGYMTQYFSLWGTLSVRENLSFLARLHIVKNQKQAIEYSLEQLGLGSRQHQIANSLSGGWKQRLALAASLIHSPKLLFLDEPTAGVDPAARQEFWQILYRLSTSGVTILVSTHYMDEAERCNKLAFLAAGELLVQGEAANIIRSQGLFALQVTGGDLLLLEKHLYSHPAIVQVTRRANALYVIGKDLALLESALSSLPSQYDISRSTMSLEDTFSYITKSHHFKKDVR